jgi:hypothetical protein
MSGVLGVMWEIIGRDTDIRSPANEPDRMIARACLPVGEEASEAARQADPKSRFHLHRRYGATVIVPGAIQSRSQRLPLGRPTG